MAVEYGATIGYFAVDEQTCRYLRQTGRPDEKVRATEKLYRAQGFFGAPKEGEIVHPAGLVMSPVWVSIVK